MSYKRTCEHCNQEFEASNPVVRFCTQRCRSEAWAARNPDRHRKRHARLKADPERWAAAQTKQHEYYLANREKILKRTAEAQKNLPREIKTRYSAKWRHGQPVDELRAAMWSLQDGKCYLCGDPLSSDGNRYVHIDHDHRNLCCSRYRTCEICRRGLACANCNTLVGKGGDDPEKLRLIADNLERAMILVDERLQK
jgi:hypothetical protein